MSHLRNPRPRSQRIVLRVPRPFSLAGTVLGYGYYELPPCCWDGRSLRRAEALDGAVYLLHCRDLPLGSRTEAAVRLTIAGDRPIEAHSQRELVRRTRVMLGLGHNLAEFYAICRREPHLRSIPRFGAGRLLRGTTLFEDTVKAIAWTNTTWPQAVKMIGKLGALGEPCPAAPDLRSWPSPERITKAGRRYLEGEAKLGYRTIYILELAERVVSGDLDLASIEGIEDSEKQAKALLGIKGAGPATVAYLQAMLGHYDRPVLDSATLGYLAKTYFRGRTPSPKQVERKLAVYGRWRGLILWFDYWLGSGLSKRCGLTG